MNLFSYTGRPFLERCFYSVTPALLMDLFDFTMQQLASPASLVCAEELPDFLAAWLRHNHYLGAGEALHPHLRLREDLALDPLAQLLLVGDAETYYEVHIPDVEIARLATVQDVQTCLCRQLARAA